MNTINNQSEFIGKNIVVPSMNITGTIINETKFTFTIRTKVKDKKVIKKNKTFMISSQEIDGNSIIKRPEERITK